MNVSVPPSSGPSIDPGPAEKVDKLGKSTSKPTVRACDGCAYRRVKCSGESPCMQCLKRDLKCEFTRPVQRRGPAGARLQRLRAKTATSPSIETQSLQQPYSQPQPPSSMPPAFPEASTSAIGLDYVNGSPGAFGDDASFGAWPVQNWFDHSNYSPAVDADHTAGMLPGVGGSLLASLALPPLTSEQPFLDLGVPGFNASPGMSTQSLDSHPSVISPDRNDFATSMPAFPSSNLITAEEQEMLINEFFRTMAPTIPVFARGYITKRIAAGEALVDEDFAALVLSMCAVVHIQPLASSELAVEANVERRKRSAEALLDEVTNLRASSNFGERPSLDTVMTSFFLFACLFGLQKFGAAWLRLQEAISLAQLLGIADPKKMEQLDPEEKERRRRAYCSLAITERAFAVQQHHQIVFKGQITYPSSSSSSPHLYEGSDIFLQRHMRLFDAVDSAFLLCWNGSCAGGTNCNALSAQDAIALDDRLAAEAASNDLIDIAADDSSSIQRTDLALTQLWLRNRLWTLCLDHGLVALHPGEQGLDGMIAFHMARQAIDMCQGVQMAHLEALGVGAAEKLYDLVEALATLHALEPEPFTLFEVGGRQAVLSLINRYYILLNAFRAGQHRYAQMVRNLVQRVSERDASMAAGDDIDFLLA